MLCDPLVSIQSRALLAPVPALRLLLALRPDAPCTATAVEEDTEHDCCGFNKRRGGGLLRTGGRCQRTSADNEIERVRDRRSLPLSFSLFFALALSLVLFLFLSAYRPCLSPSIFPLTKGCAAVHEPSVFDGRTPFCYQTMAEAPSLPHILLPILTGTKCVKLTTPRSSLDLLSLW